jgi:hypothetical protein
MLTPSLLASSRPILDLIEVLAWLDFSTITTVEMEAWIKEAGGLKFGPKKALDRLHLSAKVENAKR